MATIRTFCTNKTNEVSPGVYTVETILRRGTHDAAIATFAHSMDSDLNTGVPDSAVWDTTGSEDAVRFLTEAERVSKLLPSLLTDNKALRDEELTKGCETSVLDADGNPIRMDCQYADGANLTYLIGFMEDNGDSDTTATVLTDFSNNKHPVTLADVKQAFKDIRAHGLNLFQLKWAREEELSAATTLEEVNAVLGTNYQ